MNIEAIRKFCLSLPGVTEDLKWGNDICFLIGGKMFLVTCADPGCGASFKSDADEFEDLIERPGFIPAPYLARAKWVKAESLSDLRSDEGKRLIRRSYELVLAGLPARIRKKWQ